jgi:serine protease AprX
LGSLRFLTVLGAVIALAAAAALPAPAAPGRAPASVRPALADRNGNRISDDLDVELAHSANGTKLPVVVTYAGRGNSASARKQVGTFAVKADFTLIHGFAGTMTAAQVRALSRHAEVFRIDRDFTVHATLDAATRDFGAVAARAASWGGTGAGVTVCVVDTGVDGTHEQLNSKTIAFDDEINHRTTAYDDHSHGTHVASMIAGDGTGGSNAATFKGVAPDANIYAAKVLASNGSGSDSGVILGVQWCDAQPAVRVISLSLGSDAASDGSDSLSQATNAAVANGNAVVVAAGNSGDLPGTVGSPGAASDVITVGAVGEYSAPIGTDRRSNGIYLDWFSSRGPTSDGRTKPDVVAPGDTIRAALANSGSGYTTMSGTSMATPFVSGSVALALSVNPGLTAGQIKSSVMGTAVDWGKAGVDNDYGAGLIDTYALVAQAAGQTGATVFPTHEHAEGTVPDTGDWRKSFTVSDLSIPVAATVILNGTDGFFGWDPDIDVDILDPDGVVVDRSTCVDTTYGPCEYGRQETLGFVPTKTGTYTIRLYPYSGGGAFGLDLSYGGTPLPPPPPPPPPAGMHLGGRSGTWNAVKGGSTASILVTAHDAAHAVLSGVTVSVSWSGGASGSGSCVTGGSGTCTVTTQKFRKGTSVTFSVTNLTKSGYAYESGSNDVASTLVVTKP